MIKTLTFIAILLLNFTSFAQNNFEEGYYINSSGDRVSGYIQVENWNSNPKEITFKPSEMGPEQTILLRNMNGFGLSNSTQYDKFKVKISKSSDDISAMDRVKAFDLVEETAMLQLLVDGESQLYGYVNQGITQFFIKKDNLLTTLLYKKYLLRDGIATNNQYKQQISNLLTCDSGKLPPAKNLNYTASSLKKYVIAYNACNGSLNEAFESNESEKILAFKVMGGVQNSSFSVDGNSTQQLDYDSQNSFIPGFEIELKLPSKTKSEWSIFFDARVHGFEASDVTSFTLFTTDEVFFRETKVEYDAVDFGLGARHYLSLGENSKLFFGLNISIDFITSTSVDYGSEGITDFEGKGPTPILGLGAGYNWKDLSAEIRYYTNRDSLGGGAGTSDGSNYSNLALTLSYSLFKLSI